MLSGVVVIGCHVNGLGIIRSLARQGIPVIALYYDERADFAHVSRHVQERVRVPHPRFEESAFIGVLRANAPRWRGALILETNDDALIAIARHRDELIRSYLVPTPGWEVVRQLIEKPATYRLAAACDVPCPRSWSTETLGLPERASEVTFPCLVKPVVSHLFVAEFGVKNIRAGDASSLCATLARCAASSQDVIIQEVIPGPDANIFQCVMYIDARAESRTTFVLRKLRQNPPGFGVARVAVSHAVIPEIETWTWNMLRRIGYTGIVHSEFKLDDRDGSFKLMEINARLPRANLLAARCGMNFPLIAGMNLASGDRPSLVRYDESVYWIELAIDLPVSMLNIRSERLSFDDYARPYRASRKVFADFSRDDLRPFGMRMWNILAPRGGG
ncbi:MAG: hypothetical protein SGI90_11455 [Candidatus Eisenbacteria bacterium]|nr:hypothetical protein [Candidatus Eisenbacteria bacterium]